MFSLLSYLSCVLVSKRIPILYALFQWGILSAIQSYQEDKHNVTDVTKHKHNPVIIHHFSYPHQRTNGNMDRKKKKKNKIVCPSDSPEASCIHLLSNKKLFEWGITCRRCWDKVQMQIIKKIVSVLNIYIFCWRKTSGTISRTNIVKHIFRLLLISIAYIGLCSFIIIGPYAIQIYIYVRDWYHHNIFFVEPDSSEATCIA